MSHTITVETMREYQHSGAAHPLLATGVPGPMYFRERWWLIPTGEGNYQPATTEQAARLTAHLDRLHHAAQQQRQ